MGFAEIEVAEKFFALSVEERLTRILDIAFPIWCDHVNSGVSLVYDNTCVMVHDVTAKILGVEKVLPKVNSPKGAFEIFGSRQALRIEMALEQFGPDAGGFSTLAHDGRQPFLVMFETSIKAMTSGDFRFEPGCLLPEDEASLKELGETYERVFSAQFRFWFHDAPDYDSRREALRAGLAARPGVGLVEQDRAAPLREKNRFKLKRKEALETIDTPVTAIAIGLDFQGG